MRALLLLLVLLLTQGVSSAAPSGPPLPIRVLLPQGYSTAHRYPVVYLLNGVYADCRPECAALESALAKQPVITVLEDRPTALADYVDYKDGSQHGEQQLLATIAWVDRHYATSTDRSRRAITGVSAGGYGAMLIAAKHPSLFGAVASFSGPLDLRGKADSNEPAFVVTAVTPPLTGVPVFGVPVLDDATWKAANPTDLVSRLRGLDVYQTASSGIPCAATDVAPSIEPLVVLTNDRFDAEATRARVRHTYVRRPCGVHGYGEFAPELNDWLARHPAL